MPNFEYTTGIPDAPHNPSADQPPMQVNTNSINSILAVDHFGFNDNNGGWHEQSTYPQVTSLPTTLSNQLALFNVAGSSNNELHMVRAGIAGTETTLTTSKIGVPVAGTAGVTYLPGPSTADGGGILIQWGFVNGTHSGGFFNGGDTGTVTFSPAFPLNCFNVWTQPCAGTAVPDSQATVAISSPTISKTGFTWGFVTNSGQYNKFFWVAMGN